MPIGLPFRRVEDPKAGSIVNASDRTCGLGSGVAMRDLAR